MIIAAAVARIYTALGFHLGESDALDVAILDAQEMLCRLARTLEAKGVTDTKELEPLP